MMIATDLWHVQIPVAEKVLRTVAVYGGLAVLLRLGGKRDLAQLNTFDLVVMLLLSNVVQNAVIGPDNSVSGGLLGAAVLVGLNGGLVRVLNRHPLLERFFEGSQSVLVLDGRPRISVIRRLGLRVADVAVALRRQGASDVSQVRQAVLAPGGSIVVDLKDEDQDVTRAELGRYHEQLREQIRADVRAELQAALRTRHPEE
jgi:uncharacterized membrane protein YcaP (DUF421 family)